MRIAMVFVLAAISAFGAPAFAQSLMKNFSWSDMRAELEEAGASVTKEDVAGSTRYMAAKDTTGLVFAVYGFECDTDGASQRCTGADFVSSFTLKDPDEISDIMDEVNYASLADYKGDDGRLKIARYVIFDDGITHENLQVNIKVFKKLSNDIWDKLDEEEKLK